ncbi:hypothetical protein AAFF_G00438710 [Aldrovandia affinis]|uniref:Uncharacterized protein n=1 Tax=Aldrovandia affinis TaxID=143900 RepID=A0AAD7VYB8_9TELE|nr:hypothetical protein AAFF_G00438710 [Aldrovandia affinis]
MWTLNYLITDPHREFKFISRCWTAYLCQDPWLCLGLARFTPRSESNEAAVCVLPQISPRKLRRLASTGTAGRWGRRQPRVRYGDGVMRRQGKFLGF